jgi:GGDEF domain-containing protein
MNEANVSKQEREQAVESLELLLINSLRKGDVFCRWNPSQILLLLTNVIESNLQLIEKRIQKRFKNAVDPKKITIKIDFQPVTAIDPFIT